METSWCFLYGFHRRDSRGPVAAGNHINKTNDGNHKHNVSCHDRNHEQPTTETSPKKQQQTRNHSIHVKIPDPPATAESIKNPATETMKQRFLPRRKPLKNQRRKP